MRLGLRVHGRRRAVSSVPDPGRRMAKNARGESRRGYARRRHDDEREPSTLSDHTANQLVCAPHWLYVPSASNAGSKRKTPASGP